jgi:acyl-CoA synthetase (AMP-forming)/AMP-acid ligase II
MSSSWLFERLAGYADRPALAWRDRSYTYGVLLQRVRNYSALLDAHEVKAGRVVTLDGDFSPSCCAMLLALIQRRCILVPLAASAQPHRSEWLAIADAQWEVYPRDDDPPLISKREATVSNSLTRQLIADGKPGLILFSSGSTGKSKAALHDFEGLLEKFKKIRPAQRTVTFLLLDHIGGLNTLLHVFANGGMVVALENRDPDAVCAAIEKQHVQVLPTSPTFLNLLLVSEAYRRYDLTSLEVITYGTEPMPKTTLQRLADVLPAARLQQTYGLTELGILRSKSRDSNSLWVKLGGEGFETKVQNGTLWIRAHSAMRGYLNAPSPFDDDGWLNTEDEVEVDGEYLRILGRRSEIINVGGQKVYPAEVESVLMEMDGIADATVTGEQNPLTGQIVVARLVLAAPTAVSDLKKQVRTFCRGKLAPFKIPVKVSVAESAGHNERYKKIRRKP